MTAGPVGYIRRSAAGEENRGDVSREVQEHAIREMAHADGHNGDLRLYVDWGRSGDEAKLARRTEYAAMMRAVASGEATTVYAYALDRLHRSVVETGKLMTAIRDNRVRIVTRLEGEISDSDPIRWMLVTQLAAAAEFQLRVMKVRAQANIERRRAAGGYLGRPPYGSAVGEDGKLIPVAGEDVAAVVRAYRRTGSYLGAAAWLTLHGPAPRSGEHWADQTVRRIVRREHLRRTGEELPITNGGPKHRVPHRLDGLLTCPVCGQTLTGQKARWPVYFCGRARRDPSHPRPYAIAESKVLPWIQAEAGRLRTPERVALGQENADRREELRARRERLGWAVTDGLLERDKAAVDAAAIDAELGVLEAADAIVAVPAIDWTGTPAAVNETLTALFERVELGPDWRPTRAAWRVPDWRAAG